MDKARWIRVTRANPCPICQHGDWCGIMESGALACCMRVESGRPSKNGGWIHRLDEPLKPKFAPKKEPERPPPNFDLLLKQWRSETTPGMLAEHAGHLGVSAHSLSAIGACYAREHGAWAFPMFNEHYRVIGIRLRNVQGDKWAVRGSKSGIFRAAEIRFPVLIVEGPTDTAAGISVGITTIGRADCNSCVDILCHQLKVLATFRPPLYNLPPEEIIKKKTGALNRAIVLIEDVDCKERREGGTWNPGAEGAEKLSRSLEVPHYLMASPAKDMREAVRNGFTLDLLNLQISSMTRRVPRNYKD